MVWIMSFIFISSDIFFVANLFNNYPALEQVDSNFEMDIQEETREEKSMSTSTFIW